MVQGLELQQSSLDNTVQHMTFSLHSVLQGKLTVMHCLLFTKVLTITWSLVCLPPIKEKFHKGVTLSVVALADFPRGVTRRGHRKTVYRFGAHICEFTSNLL